MGTSIKGKSPKAVPIQGLLRSNSVVLQEKGYAGSYVFDGRIARDIHGDPDGQPQAVKILFLKPTHTLSLKQLIPALDPHNFWYKREGQKLEWRSTASGRNQSIEITLTPPFLTYDTSEILTVEGLPVPPYSYLLLSSLWRWALLGQETAQESPSINSSQGEEIERQKDSLAKDILSMLLFLFSGSGHTTVNSTTHFDKSLKDACQLVVEGFCKEHPTTRKLWGKLGIRKEGDIEPEQLSQAPPRPTYTWQERRPWWNDRNTDWRNKVETGKAMVDGRKLAGTSSASSSSRTTARTSGRASNASPSTERKRSQYDIRYQAAQTTIDILENEGYRCALFGSMACRLYGNGRMPEDVDILVIPPSPPSSITPDFDPSLTTEEQAQRTQEHIKSLLVAHCPPESHYVLVKSRNPHATHRVLYWMPNDNEDKNQGTQGDNDDDLVEAIRRLKIEVAEATTKASSKVSPRPSRFNSTKVDIFVPPSFALPSLPPSLRTYKGKLPCVPYPLLLAHKLKGWVDHKERLDEARKERNVSEEGATKEDNRGRKRTGNGGNSAADESRKLTKVSQDVSDLKWLIGGLGTYGGEGRGGGGRSRYWPYWERVYQVQVRLDRGGGVSQYWSWGGGTGAPGGNAGARVWEDRQMFSEEFEMETRERVKVICREHPEMREGWRAVGFDVE